MKIKKYIRNKPYTINLDDDYTILDLASLILNTNTDSIVIINSSNQPVYIITNSDILHFFVNSLQNLTITEIMKKFPKELITIQENEDLYEAHKLMRKYKIEHILVLNEKKKLIGEIFYNDLIIKFVEFSLKDELSGLNNRRFLDTILARYENSDRPIGFIFVDVDDFKFINDTFGHKEGDFVVAKIGEIIRNSIRDMDFGFRYGGDEFLILIFNANKEVLEKITQRIFDKISNIKLNNKNISVSVGVSLYPKESNDLNQALKLADNRLYAVKNNGKGKIYNG